MCYASARASKANTGRRANALYTPRCNHARDSEAVKINVTSISTFTSPSSKLIRVYVLVNGVSQLACGRSISTWRARVHAHSAHYAARRDHARAIPVALCLSSFKIFYRCNIYRWK
ncbi:hypothetical protein PUN28_002789 [Cardiocondyla obscurior]|uniref:Uncharacterized protein n=1 Tax=Cardiocondyla obscurior TaxID=286306 RepID=A0AAW2GW54_9HYME